VEGGDAEARRGSCEEALWIIGWRFVRLSVLIRREVQCHIVQS
jgi:hypothetical protein